MPRRRFVGQHLVDFLKVEGYETCPEPEGPPTGTVVMSRDCADPESQILLVHATVELGAVYAETILGNTGIAAAEFWSYLDGV